MFYALKLKQNDFEKAQVGIGSVWYESNPCNNHLNSIAKLVKKGIKKKYNETLIGFRFNSVGISDGISMGTDGMKYSLPSREIIADSVETYINGHHNDGLITVAGCDKNLPGCLMGMIRVNRPSLMIYGGSIKPGVYRDTQVDVVDAFQSYGQLLNNKISEKERDTLLKCCCPGAGSCAGMYTANTMASAIEAMGMILPNGASNIADSIDKKNEASNEAPDAIYNLLKNNIVPSDIITKKSIENAIVTMMALGGSTNGVLHILAIAKTANIDITLDDFNTIGDRTPLIGNLKPFGQYSMVDIYNNGGLQPFLKYLLDKKMLYGDCLTVTGKTMNENLGLYTNHYLCPEIYKTSVPLKNNSHIKILKGNIAKNGCVAKITGKEGTYFKGTANVFESERGFIESLKLNKIKEGDVIVIRNQGPKGGPGMPEMLKPTASISGYGLNGKIAFITDGRFSGGSHGFIIGHISPEAQNGGEISIVENGDIIEIDTTNKHINLLVEDQEIEKRMINRKNNNPQISSGVLKKYIKLVGCASQGCVTDL